MTAAISPACSRRRWRAPTSKASSSASATARRAGKLRGFGVACYVETTAAMTTELGGDPLRCRRHGHHRHRHARLRQGHATTFAQVLTEKLGVPFERIRLVQGDSDQLVIGGGTGGSRSAMLSGTAIAQASDKVIEHGKQIAAHVLEASAGDIEFKAGRFVIAGTDRSIGIMELAAAFARRPDAARRRAHLARRHARHRSRSPAPSRTAFMSPRWRSRPTPASPAR